ncbi:hypothetical protein HK096_002015 [Nowakowskiella sp. JEL0078]|nr:hypothetical protein HK096_002015 [Nowakowskiella sp. JEL0078]
MEKKDFIADLTEYSNSEIEELLEVVAFYRPIDIALLSGKSITPSKKHKSEQKQITNKRTKSSKEHSPTLTSENVPFNI